MKDLEIAADPLPEHEPPQWIEELQRAVDRIPVEMHGRLIRDQQHADRQEPESDEPRTSPANNKRAGILSRLIVGCRLRCHEGWLRTP